MYPGAAGGHEIEISYHRKKDAFMRVSFIMFHRSLGDCRDIQFLTLLHPPGSLLGGVSRQTTLTTMGIKMAVGPLEMRKLLEITSTPKMLTILTQLHLSHTVRSDTKLVCSLLLPGTKLMFSRC